MIDRELHFAIGRRVKLIRSAEKVTQKELAVVLGISQTHLSNMENGVVGLTVDNIVKCSEFFSCDIRCFFDDKFATLYRATVTSSPNNLTTSKKILSDGEKNKGVFDIDSEALDKVLKILEILKK